MTSGKDLMWTVKDNESGITIDFREGLFNETQEVKLPADFAPGDVMKLARIMREIGAWMAAYHSDVVLCEWEERRSAI